MTWDQPNFQSKIRIGDAELVLDVWDDADSDVHARLFGPTEAIIRNRMALIELFVTKLPAAFRGVATQMIADKFPETVPSERISIDERWAEGYFDHDNTSILLTDVGMENVNRWFGDKVIA